MNLAQYILHPELLGRTTLYDLRRLVALYPYYQPARLMLVRTLYLLHDPSFADELRHAALFLSDRSTLFAIVEGPFYSLKKEEHTTSSAPTGDAAALINTFLDSASSASGDNPAPPVADAHTDYMAYILSGEGSTDKEAAPSATATTTIIENFLGNDGGKLSLDDHPSSDAAAPHDAVPIENDRDDLQEGFYTENLAKVYIKQGNYSKALEIITQINLNNSAKNPYFADQKRYLEKVISIKNKEKG